MRILWINPTYIQVIFFHKIMNFFMNLLFTKLENITFTSKKTIILKKYLLIVISGLLCLLTLISFCIDRQFEKQSNRFMVINNLKCSDYSIFSSSFFFIKNKSLECENKFIKIPDDVQTLRLILKPEKLIKGQNINGFMYNNKLLYFNILPKNSQNPNEALVVDVKDVESNTLQQYLIFSSILFFLLFLTSLIKTIKK